MKIYLVGGAVRDQLLHLPVQERDYVVVGATVDEMLKKGYKQVGKDFPVFLHPETSDEYALARVERKVGKGYTGFAFDASSHVSLEEDLMRRDLTINAIAQSIDGEIVDPYRGKKDLEKKILRHVSSAFVEDPVRILRVARFYARFAHLRFTIAPETMKLMRDMVKAGEVDALVAERVWKEMEKALREQNPEKFFETLTECGADTVLLFKKFDLQVLIRASQLTPNPVIRFAVLFYNQSPQYVEELCDRYRIPNEYRELALLVSRFFSEYKNAESLSPEQILSLLQMTDAFRRPERFNNFLLACESCLSSNIKSSAKLLSSCFELTKTIDTKEFVNAGLSGKEIAEKIKEKRLRLLANRFNKPSF